MANSQNKFMGDPCKHGHDGLRWVRNRECVSCTAAHSKKWKMSDEYKRQQREYAAKRLSDPAFRAARNAEAVAKTAARRAANPEKYEKIEAERRRKLSDLGKSFRGARHAAKQAGEKFYDPGKPCPRGHRVLYRVSGGCTECSKMHGRKDYAANAEKHRAKASAHSKTEKAAATRARRYANLSPEKKEKLRAEARERSRKWRKEKRAHATFLSSLNKKAVRIRTPVWADRRAIKKFYEERPEGYHVDHIIPLSGINVSGLHVRENLQYLPALENMRKNRYFPAEGIEHSFSAEGAR